MKLTVNIVTDETGTMTATVPEVPGLVVEADDLGEIFAEITDRVPEMTEFDSVRPCVNAKSKALQEAARLSELFKDIKPESEGWGGVYLSQRVYDGVRHVDSASAEGQWMRNNASGLAW